jgi:hypothetical protein
MVLTASAANDLKGELALRLGQQCSSADRLRSPID